MSLTLVLIYALLIGMVCGLRSMTGPALVCWGAHLGWLHLNGSHLAFLHSKISLVIFTLFAIGELIADKTPKIPPRTQAGPLIVRILSGAMCGAALAIAASSSLVVAAIGGAVGAVIGTFGGYQARRGLTTTRGLPDLPVALTEDLIAVGVGLLVVSRFVAAVTVS